VAVVADDPPAHRQGVVVAPPARHRAVAVAPVARLRVVVAGLPDRVRPHRVVVHQSAENFYSLN
jgi:hypothetical protein